MTDYNGAWFLIGAILGTAGGMTSTLALVALGSWARRARRPRVGVHGVPPVTPGPRS